MLVCISPEARSKFKAQQHQMSSKTTVLYPNECVETIYEFSREINWSGNGRLNQPTPL